MSHCPPLEELSALVDGELSGKHELQLRWHIDLCPVCAQRAAGVVRLKRAVGRTRGRDIPSPALRRRVVACVSEGRRPRRSRMVGAGGR